MCNIKVVAMDACIIRKRALHVLELRTLNAEGDYRIAGSPKSWRFESPRLSAISPSQSGAARIAKLLHAKKEEWAESLPKIGGSMAASLSVALCSLNWPAME